MQRKLFILFFATILATGCGLDKKLKKAAQDESNAIARAGKTVESFKVNIDQDLKKEPFLKTYHQREKWQSTIDEAKTKVKEALDFYVNKVKPVLDRNKEKENILLNSLLKKCATYRHKASKLLNQVKARKDKLLQYKAKAPQLVIKAKNDLPEINRMLKSPTLHEDLAIASKNYPGKAKDLAKRKQEFIKQAEKAQRNWQRADAMLKTCSQAESTECDYDILGKSSETVFTIKADVKEDLAELKKQIIELDYSVERVLLDLSVKAEFTVCYGWEQWDESSDASPSKSTECKKVNQKEYEHPTEGKRCWKKSGKWYSSTLCRETWVEDKESEFAYYGKFKEIRVDINNKPTTRTFEEELDADEYQKLEKALGMSVYSKAKGKYKEDANDDPHPAGYDQLRPGVNGEWKKREDGTSFWEFYGKYMFMRSLFWPHSYYGYGYSPMYGSWHHYHYNYRRPGGSYYGRTYYGNYGNRSARYGTRDTYGSKYHARSSYRRNGGYKSYRSYTSRNASNAVRQRSIRSASRRGRGPGGGGK